MYACDLVIKKKMQTSGKTKLHSTHIAWTKERAEEGDRRMMTGRQMEWERDSRERRKGDKKVWKARYIYNKILNLTDCCRLGEMLCEGCL
jgi:hypothetical protein